MFKQYLLNINKICIKYREIFFFQRIFPYAFLNFNSFLSFFLPSKAHQILVALIIFLVFELVFFHLLLID
jgi:hypothetical protein